MIKGWIHHVYDDLIYFIYYYSVASIIKYRFDLNRN